jgi:UPF0271 protein
MSAAELSVPRKTNPDKPPTMRTTPITMVTMLPMSTSFVDDQFKASKIGRVACRDSATGGTMTNMEIDLNSDLGEGCPFDEQLMPLITSANIACGFHAGDAATAKATLAAAVRHGVHAGAHPSFLDREHFGRRELVRTEDEIFAETVYQVGALLALARAGGQELRHIKPHGALYNMACRDDAYARPLVRAAEHFSLPLLGLPGSRLEALCAGKCDFVAEGFADRRYLPDGSLVPRSRADAMIESPADAVRQVEWLVRERKVRTICVHGDNPHALDFVRALRTALMQQGFVIRALS